MKFTLVIGAVIMSAFNVINADPVARSVKKVKATDIPNPPVGTHIFGGSNAKKGAYPFQAALHMDSGSFCGGSLISAEWILTAAHCLTDVTSVDVILGSLDSENGTSFQSDEIIIHEMYNTETLEHDIGLVKLSTAAPISAKNKLIKTIELQGRSKSCGSPNSKLTVIGWGYIDEDETNPTVLQYVSLQEITNTDCFDAYTIGQIPPTVMCAKGSKNPMATVCSGDSGGPLFSGPSTKPLQVGIVSFGVACGDGTPSGFTRVGSYIDWITIKTGLDLN